MKQENLNVLFLCTGNSARSIMAESILNSLGKPKFKAFSAGSRPAGSVESSGAGAPREEPPPTVGLRSKDWSEFSRPARLHAFRLYRVRSGGGGILSGLARPTDDRALGCS